MVTEEQIEQDELNQHECTLTLMKLLDHMELNKINPQVPKVTMQMPSKNGRSFVPRRAEGGGLYEARMVLNHGMDPCYLNEIT